VDVKLMTNATKISAGSVTLGDGQELATATAICTIGTVPNALLATLGGAKVERGRLVADGTMQVAGVTGLWAMGDCALVPNAMATPNAPAGASCPPTAQCAVAQGKRLAANLAAVLRGRSPQAFAWQSRGMMATVGHLRGVALVGPLMISGLPAWMLWRAYYLSQIPTLGRKIRIYVEWTWGMFFPPDITHMRFETSRERHVDKDDM